MASEETLLSSIQQVSQATRTHGPVRFLFSTGSASHSLRVVIGLSYSRTETPPAGFRNTVSIRAAEEAGRLDLRKSTVRQGDVRLVEVEQFDFSACGGTHVSGTGALGMILVRKFARIKDQTRVEFVRGRRPMKIARQDFLLLDEASRLLSASPLDLPARVRRLAEEQRAAIRTQENLLERLSQGPARRRRTAPLP